jgi:hypothetical protein
MRHMTRAPVRRSHDLPTQDQLIDYFIFDAEDIDVGTFSRAKTDEVAAHFKISPPTAFRALDALADQGILFKTRDIMKGRAGKKVIGYQWWEYGWKPGDTARYEEWERSRGDVSEVAEGQSLCANGFIELLTSMVPADRQTRISFQPSIAGERGGGRVYVNFINLPLGAGGAGGGAEAENNRASFWIDGFQYDPNIPVAKIKIEQSNNVFHRPWLGAPGVPFRAKSGSPAVVARYLADYLARIVATVPPRFTHTT